MTTVSYALGEVQKPTEPATRHAVADAMPGEWGRSACSLQQRVWVHVAAGAAIPYPGPIGDDMACPECTSIVAAALPSPAEQFKREKSRWTSLIWKRDEPS